MDTPSITKKQTTALLNMISWYKTGEKKPAVVPRKEKERISKLNIEEASKEIKKWIKKVDSIEWIKGYDGEYDDWLWK